jgi:hypothetical protein
MTNQREDFQVIVDPGTSSQQILGTFQPTTTTYTDITTNAFNLTAGTHVIQFKGVNSFGGDNTALIDNVRVSAANQVATSIGLTPSASPFAMPAGASQH